MNDPFVFHNPDDLAAHLEKRGVPARVARARFQAIQELYPSGAGGGAIAFNSFAGRISDGFHLLNESDS